LTGSKKMSELNEIKVKEEVFVIKDLFCLHCGDKLTTSCKNGGIHYYCSNGYTESFGDVENHGLFGIDINPLIELSIQDKYERMPQKPFQIRNYNKIPRIKCFVCNKEMVPNLSKANLSYTCAIGTGDNIIFHTNIYDYNVQKYLKKNFLSLEIKI